MTLRFLAQADRRASQKTVFRFAFVYQTARTDLLDLEKRGVLKKRMLGNKMTFESPRNLADKLHEQGKEFFGGK